MIKRNTIVTCTISWQQTVAGYAEEGPHHFWCKESFFCIATPISLVGCVALDRTSIFKLLPLSVP